MKKYLLPALISFLTISIFSAHAAGSIVSCDGADCTWPKIWEILRTVIRTVLGLVVLLAGYRIATLWLNKEMNPENPNARKEFTNNALVIFIATVLLAALLPLTIYGLKALKVSPNIIQKIECLQKAGPKGSGCEATQLPQQFFNHAYAQSLLLQTVDIGGGIYDFFFRVFQLLMRVLFLALIIFITYSGFMLVSARGEPTALEKAKSRLWYSVYITVILMLVQVLLLALGDSINK